MRVAILASTAQARNAIGNQIAEKVRFFRERGADVRLHLQSTCQLHPDLSGIAVEGADAYLSTCDLAFVIYAEYFELLQMLPLLTGAGPRVIFEYHGVTPATLWPDRHREQLLQSARERGHVWCADHVLTASRFILEELTAATGFPGEHAATLPFPIDTTRFHPGSERHLHERLGIDGRILLFVGRVAHNKRIDLLISALGRLNDPTLHAVIVGDTSDIYAVEAARCQALACEAGVADRVHWLGQLDDAELPRAYRSAAVFVMPSLHEGFCIPVVEAMACGVPVVASRSAALPETIADAGLTFAAGDAEDLARTLARVLGCRAERHVENVPHGSRRVAIVCFRFGPEIVGGAETSLGVMARALQAAGDHVEVFTTRTRSESRWRDELPAGTATIDGLTVHRFGVDEHDVNEHGEIVRAILEADGRVEVETEQKYLAHSIHSAELLEELRRRSDEFDVIITGPYLFGLTVDIANAFGQKVVLVPCFHDEPLARLSVWPRLYSGVGGVLFHSPEEQDFAQRQLGVNHPNSHVVGTWMSAPETPRMQAPDRPYVLYCGRYSEQKNVPLLLDWATRFQAEHPGKLDFVFIGRGDVRLPDAPWVRDFGHVDEATKQSLVAGARALVQLSTHESLSIVALEAWALGTPIIIHADCAVLSGQVQRSQGGVAVGDCSTFADTLDDLLRDPQSWQERGHRGQAYFRANYSCKTRFTQILQAAIDRIGLPLVEQMRDRGLQRARAMSRARWTERFAAFVEGVLSQPARTMRDDLLIEVMRADHHVPDGTRTLLIPVRITNRGTHAALASGPASTFLCGDMGDQRVGAIPLSSTLVPGASLTMAFPVSLPGQFDFSTITLSCERRDQVVSNTPLLAVRKDGAAGHASATGHFLDAVHEALTEAQALQDLPSDYIDVSEGAFAGIKKLIKRKLLNNFKNAYVDVLSRQQTRVNRQVVVMVQQLAECCAVLDSAVQGLHHRLDRLEARLEESASRDAEGARDDPRAPLFGAPSCESGRV
jgi:glycosyltransferase involved in cell wall biosynthesis